MSSYKMYEKRLGENILLGLLYISQSAVSSLPTVALIGRNKLNAPFLRSLLGAIHKIRNAPRSRRVFDKASHIVTGG